MNLCRKAKTKLHAEAMSRSADFYDHIKEFSKPGMNSTSPGQWLTEACASDEAETEHSDSARAIIEAYRFAHRFRFLRFPGAEGPRNQAGDEVFAGYLAHETKSIRVVEFTKHRASNPISYSEIRDCDTTPVQKKETRKVAKTPAALDHFPYEMVTATELNAHYAAYVAGKEKVTAESVMESVTNYCLRKIALGTNEHGLRTRGEAGALLSEFWERMSAAVVDKRFKGSNGGRFNLYVDAAWANRRNTAYSKLSRQDDRFKSSTFSGTNLKDADGKTTQEVFSSEDRYAQSLHETDLSAASEAAHARELLASHLAKLKGKSLWMVEDMIAGIEQKETAARLGKSRDAVGRTQRQFKKDVLGAGLDAKTEMVA